MAKHEQEGWNKGGVSQLLLLWEMTRDRPGLRLSKGRDVIRAEVRRRNRGCEVCVYRSGRSWWRATSKMGVVVSTVKRSPGQTECSPADAGND